MLPHTVKDAILAREEVLGGAALDYFSVFHDDDPIHCAQCREAVSYGNDRVVGEKLLETILDQRLAFAIERARRLVKHENGRGFE